MRNPYSTQNKVFFYGIMAVLAGLGWWLIRGYLDVIVFSLCMVVILKPVYNFCQQRLKLGPGLATTGTLVILVLVILIPGSIMLRIVTNQINLITADAASSMTGVENLRTQANEWLAELPFFNQWTITDEQVAEVQAAAMNLLTRFGLAIANLGMGIPTLLAKLFVFLAIVGVLLPNYHSFVRWIMRISPLDDEVDYLYLRKIKAMVWAMFIGIVVIALAQGLMMGLFIWLGGVPYTPLWTLIAVIASALPLGASLIAFPLAIFELLMGNPVSALIILGGYILVVSNIDSILRPKLVSKEAYLDAALVLVAALGGYDLMGFFGVVYGPVLMVLLITTIEVYDKYYADRPAPPEADN